jgi:hypothetical protein
MLCDTLLQCTIVATTMADGPVFLKTREGNLSLILVKILLLLHNKNRIYQNSRNYDNILYCIINNKTSFQSNVYYYSPYTSLQFLNFPPHFSTLVWIEPILNMVVAGWHLTRAFWGMHMLIRRHAQLTIQKLQRFHCTIIVDIFCW